MPLIRRVYRQGNSYVVSLPEWILELMQMKVGDKFTVEPIGRTEIRLRPFREPHHNEHPRDEENNE